MGEFRHKYNDPNYFLEKVTKDDIITVLKNDKELLKELQDPKNKKYYMGEVLEREHIERIIKHAFSVAIDNVTNDEYHDIRLNGFGVIHFSYFHLRHYYNKLCKEVGAYTEKLKVYVTRVKYNKDNNVKLDNKNE